MTASITTDTLLAKIMTANDIRRLTPQGGDTDEYHEKAWTDTLLRLAARPTPIAETDLADSDELIPAVVHDVAKQMFALGRDLGMTEHHRKEYLRQLNLINPSIIDADSTDDVSVNGWGGTIEMGVG